MPWPRYSKKCCKVNHLRRAEHVVPATCASSEVHFLCACTWAPKSFCCQLNHLHGAASACFLYAVKSHRRVGAGRVGKSGKSVEAANYAVCFLARHTATERLRGARELRNALEAKTTSA